jgi:hypothetical protein
LEHQVSVVPSLLEMAASRQQKQLQHQQQQ